MRKIILLGGLFFCVTLFAEPIKKAYTISIHENTPTRIVFTVNINEQYDWSESDSAVSIFFGIPRFSSFKVNLVDATPIPMEREAIFSAHEAGIMHGLKIGTIDIFPFTKAGFISRLSFELRFSTPYTDNDKCYSLPFFRIYNAFLINPPPLGTIKNAGRYLIISGVPFIQSANFLAEWKRKMGYEVFVASTSTTGTTPNNILNYIRTRYNNANTRPDFVLFYGDVQFPGGNLPDYGYSGYTSDFTYSLLEGTDIFPDVLLGRLSVDTQPEGLVVASKTINYEKDPLSSGSGWLLRGVGVATYVHAVSAVTSVLWFRECLLRHSFENVDTFFYGGTMTITPSMIAASVNNGVHYVDYRGWAGSDGWWEPRFSVSDVLSLRNTGMTPVVTSIVCGTGEYGDSYLDPTFAEAWLRVGTPTALRGGVAFFGTTDHSTHTRYNNPINEGFYFGVFDCGLETIGEAVLSGKMELYARMVSERTTTVVKYFHTYNLLADPGLVLRTGVPKQFILAGPTLVERGGGNYVFDLRANPGGEYVQGANVAIYSPRDSTVIFTLSDEFGKAQLFLPNLTSDTVFFTVSKRDFVPVSLKLPVVSTAPIIKVISVFVSDGFPGNYNGVVEPFEGASISVRLNCSERIVNPLIVLDSPSPGVEFDSASFRLPELTEGENGIRFGIKTSSLIPNGEIPIYMVIRLADGTATSTVLYVPSGRLPIEISNVIVADTLSGGDGDGRLEIGESALLWVELRNNTLEYFDTLVVSYAVKSGFVSVYEYEPLKFFGVPGSGGRRISSVPIKVKLSSLAIDGTRIEIAFRMKDGAEERDLNSFYISVPTSGSYYPVGPDRYGYICLSDLLVGRYPDAPTYSWVEISPMFGGSGSLILSTDDTVEVIHMPFPLKFYGNTYDRISLSSNGWVAPDSVPPFLFQFYNLPIPHPGGPWGIIAPFWDDLSPHIGGVYYYYDEYNHRVIFEWSNVPHATTGAIQTFQLIIYDADNYPTTTGDCEIVFQYRTINDNDSEENFSTVGIASPDLSDGIQYLYSRGYASGASTLESGRALKFTTNLPLCNIKGHIYLDDGADNVNAMVFISGGPETSTDPHGNFILRMLPPDTIKLIAKKQGYFPAETSIALMPYTTVDDINLTLRKIPQVSSIEASKGDTMLTIRWILPDGVSPDSIKLYRSNILGGAPKNIATLPRITPSFSDTSAKSNVKYYYYASLIFGENESNLSSPDSGWIGATYAPSQTILPEKLAFDAYPNPFNSVLVIELSKPSSGEIVVRNVLGQTVLTQEISKKSFLKLDFSKLGSGVYFISLRNGKQIIETRRVILLK